MEWLTNTSEEEFVGLALRSDLPRIQGRPKATPAHTVAELEAMGLIGVYAITEIDEKFTEVEDVVHSDG